MKPGDIAAISVLSLIIGGLLVAGWFLYPIVTGHWPVLIISPTPSVGDHVRLFGTVKDVQTHILGVRAITLNGLGNTYIVTSSGVKEGDWVMVEGYAFGYSQIGMVILGTLSARTISVEAKVVPYSVTLLYLGLGLMVLSAALFGIALTTRAIAKKEYARSRISTQRETASWKYKQRASAAVDTWLSKGRKLGELGRHDEALECFNKALRINRALAVKAYFYKGVAFHKLERYEEAKECWQWFIETAPASEAEHVALAKEWISAPISRPARTVNEHKEEEEKGEKRRKKKRARFGFKISVDREDTKK